jgi:hypothetical protein
MVFLTLVNGIKIYNPISCNDNVYTTGLLLFPDGKIYESRSIRNLYNEERIFFYLNGNEVFCGAGETLRKTTLPDNIKCPRLLVYRKKQLRAATKPKPNIEYLNFS